MCCDVNALCERRGDREREREERREKEKEREKRREIERRGERREERRERIKRFREGGGSNESLGKIIPRMFET